MTSRLFSFFSKTAFIVTLASSAPAQAGVITSLVGQDDGVAIGGGYTASLAAQTSFLTAASGFGPVNTHGFGNQTVGTSSGTFLNGDGTWSSTDVGGCCTNGLSGVSNIVFGGTSNWGFNVNTANGSGNYLAMQAGTATFNFTVPTHSFGFFATGIQSPLGNTFTVAFNDGSAETLNIPINGAGGVEYFGFTDSASFTSVVISRPPIINGLTTSDNWGIDNVSINVSRVAVPLPGTLPLFASGLTALGLLGWRRKRKSSAI